jgi:hypothetical protein
VIEDMVIAVEVEAKKRIAASGIGMTGEEKLEWVMDRIDEFLKKFGISLDSPIVKNFVEAQVAKLASSILAEIKEQADKLKPPSGG